ncbi:Gap junction Cx32.2 protein [Oryzias melastigma]|uniref:Gap junction Cx32.2 protein n=1 Tax=Oryzias melastigma TaxID=30732 RepID=A0A834EYL1_ORYME|nr:Gap junction Cx32.2 protein [Oryzias melastigma]
MRILRNRRVSVFLFVGSHPRIFSTWNYLSPFLIAGGHSACFVTFLRLGPAAKRQIMGDWSYLSRLLDKVQSHSTVVGKIWMSVLFLFRIFVLGAAADDVWDDEASEFSCDIHEPGCEYACYNQRFPISHVRYWVLQIVFVSAPTLVYLGHAVFIVHREKKMMENGGILKGSRYTDDRGKLRIKGILFCTYMTQLIFKILLEVGFTVGQLYIYDSQIISLHIPCKLEPCSRETGAECYISRPTEKTFFIFFMFGVTGLSVLLNIIEIIYLLCSRRRMAAKRTLREQEALSSQIYSASPTLNSAGGLYAGLQTPSPHFLSGKDDEGEDFSSKEKEN